MSIHELLELKRSTEVSKSGYIVNVEKKISKKGLLFYMLDLVDSTSKIKVCVCPLYYQGDIESFALTASYVTPHTLKLQCNVSEDKILPICYLIKLEENA
jgi:DNA polymerase III alpha subunit